MKSTKTKPDLSKFQRPPPTISVKKRSCIRTYDAFCPDDQEIEVTEDDPIIEEISQKIRLLTLQVSRIECRLADLETRSTRPLIEPFGPGKYPDYSPVFPANS